MTAAYGVTRAATLSALVGIAGLGLPERLSGAPLAATEPAAAQAPAPAGAGPAFATLEAAQGQVTVIRLGQAQPPSLYMPLQLNDILVTKYGRATVRFSADGTLLRVGPGSRIQIDESATERNVKVFFGRLWAHVVRWKERTTRFSSSGTIAAIRGTELSFAVETDGDRTQLAVLEGRVLAENDAGKIELTGGQSATARKGTAPTRGVRVRAKDAVQWALYYPPVLTPKPGEMGEGAAWQAKARESAEAWGKGDVERALASLEGLADTDIRDPRFFNYRASLLLATGSVEDAARNLERAEKLAPGNSDTLALQSIIGVARAEDDKALSLARRAAAADPKSAAAQIALSYAQQAAFDLEAAGASLEKAVQLEPTDALAWARLAEIRSSLGDLGGALEAARKGADLAPGLARSQTVLGFAYLTQVRTREARAALEQAVGLDPSDPLPRLGLGLARIRDGELAEGSKDIEVAVSLDPGQSLLRSYLGKAYFESKREELVGREYELAKQADPKDPTPYLYDAIAKQTTNRPVEALEDVQKAIELNDNRAVYRSRLLLDSDLAARSASLGRIYADLGFQDRALVEGWNSVNTDPTSYSAHRFLADSYAALPRHEIARVSELLQSQLLQPINTTPIQPRLAESNLFLISAGGPGALAFNEFNPLFNRNGVNLQGSGLVGEDGLWSGEGILAGIYQKLSFSAGYNQFSTDGWRENAFQKDKLANAFLQLELSPQTSVQAEYRYRDRSHGDLQQTFFKDNFFPGLVDEQERHNFRVGGRHSFSPSSTVLASFTYQDADSRITIDEIFGPDSSYEATLPETSHGAEVQHLYRSQHFDVTTGVGYFNVDGVLRLKFEAFGMVDELPPVPTKFDHINAYAYGHFKPATSVTVTAGGSFDRLKGDFPNSDGDKKQQFNPKIGLLWNPAPGTTVRASAFRTLKRTLITDQTLEPTQVSGLNQFFDEPNLADVWRYGGGVDQKLGRHSFGGVEFSKRDLTVPGISQETFTTVEAAEDQYLARAYLFTAPHPWLALRAQYIYERFDRDDILAIQEFRTLRTHRVPLGVGFFHPSGLSAAATATYWKQEGEFPDPFGLEFRSGKDDFWLVDLAINYRLPKRYGFISIGVRNLFDTDFNYFDVDYDNPVIQPKRTFFARVTLAVP